MLIIVFLPWFRVSFSPGYFRVFRSQADHVWSSYTHCCYCDNVHWNYLWKRKIQVLISLHDFSHSWHLTWVRQSYAVVVFHISPGQSANLPAVLFASFSIRLLSWRCRQSQKPCKTHISTCLDLKLGLTKNFSSNLRNN